MIFRKVSDMKREKELAERRKNEPKLDTNQDHLVRKIFSRFRKGGSTSSGNLLSGVTIPTSAGGANVSNGPCGSQSGTPSHCSRDIERGELFQQLSGEDSTGGGGAGSSPRREKLGLVKALSKQEDETGSGPGSRASSAKSKWGRMIRGGSGSSDAADAGGDFQQSLQTLMPSIGTKASSSSGSTSKTSEGTTVRAQSAGSGNKIHPKLSRVPERQESVDEPQPMDRSRLKASQAFSTSVSADYSPSAGHHLHHQQQLTRSDSSSIIDSFTELKQEVRSEVQRINHKMSRLEDILGEILVRLTPASVVAATSSPAGPISVRPPPMPCPRTPGGRVRSSQVAPAPIDTSSSSSGANPFLIVPGDGGTTTGVAIDVDGGSGVESGSDTRNGSRTGRTSRSRPRSAGTGDKLTTQFQEYV